jgi:putative heme iron utilization protein
MTKPGDPVSEGARGAIDHLNEDHPEALLDMARALGGCPEATAARCLDADRTGLDLIAETPAGETEVRVPYDEPIEEPGGLRRATVVLAKRAQLALGEGSAQPPIKAVAES